MKRDLHVLAERPFDVVVVGAGIYGAAIARRAAQHGLYVALVDQGDFGSGTSANSLKILHGGLRYLQRGDLVGLRASIVARRRWFSMAPNLVRPCAFATPSHGCGRHSRAAFRSALAVNDLVGFDRNRGVDRSIRIGRGRMISQEQFLGIAPGLRGHSLSGGAVWFDGLIRNTERMTLAFVRSAVADGTCAANYLHVDGYVSSGGHIAGVSATDVLSGQRLAVLGKIVIHATGPWEPEFRQQGEDAAGRSGESGWAKAVNVVVGRQIFRDYAVGLPAGLVSSSESAIGERGDRFYFFVPWNGHTMIGTTYRWVGNSSERCGVTPPEIEALIRAANSSYPEAELSIKDVIFAHAGYLPAILAQQGAAEDMRLLRRDRIQLKRGAGATEAVITVSGVKYTGAIEAADKVVRLIRHVRGGRATRLREDGVVWGGEEGPCGAGGPESPEQLRSLQSIYGSKFAEVLRYMGPDTGGDGAAAVVGRRVHAEILYAIGEEMAVRLEDAVFRRTDICAHGHPGRDMIAACGAIMGQELDWGARRLAEEVARVESQLERRCFAGR